MDSDHKTATALSGHAVVTVTSLQSLKKSPEPHNKLIVWSVNQPLDSRRYKHSNKPITVARPPRAGPRDRMFLGLIRSLSECDVSAAVTTSQRAVAGADCGLGLRCRHRGRGAGVQSRPCGDH